MSDVWTRYKFAVRDTETGVVCYRTNERKLADETALYIGALDGRVYVVEERLSEAARVWT